MTRNVNYCWYDTFENKNKEGTKMNFTAYIERQKNLILNRRMGEEQLITGGTITLLRPSDEIFLELAAMPSLAKSAPKPLYPDVER
jgi:hypothetical protein